MENRICKKENCNNLVQNIKNKYCSKECYLIDRSENNPTKSKEIRDKISNSNKNRIPWNKGKKGIYSEETINKIKEARAKQVFSEDSIIKKSEFMKEQWADKDFREKRLKKAYFKKGVEHPDWDGGKSFEPYSPEFNKELKKFIKNRDLNICQTPNCMNTERLHIHHIDYDKKNSKSENLITLCHSCHMKTNVKKDREYYKNFYTEILNLYL